MKPEVGCIVGGGYVLQDCLVKGGTANVFVGQPGNGQRAAVKIFRDPVAAWRKHDFAQFFAELMASLELNGLQFPRVLGFGMWKDSSSVDEYAYIIMSLLQGATLHVVQRRFPGAVVPPETVQKWMIQACEALSLMHARGWVHRDVKPSNLIVTESGDIVLLDFGSVWIPGTSPPWQEYQVGLTEGYIPPEIWRPGKWEEFRRVQPCPTHDVYSLGRVMVALLTGHPERDEALSRFASDGLLTVIRRCLAPKPSDRYKNARELACALRAA